MPKPSFLRDISAGTAQALAGQLSGAATFFLLSGYLDKAALGELNWTLALLLVVFSILGFGWEPVAVHKVATGMPPEKMLGLYLRHVVNGCCMFVGVTTMVFLLMPNHTSAFLLFLPLGIAQCLQFAGSPFRQVTNGMQEYRLLFFMSSTAPLLRMILTVAMIAFGIVSLKNIIILYVASAAAELVVCVLLYRLRFHLPVGISRDGQGYRDMLLSSLPQTGVVIFNTAIGRLDWILVGWMAGPVVVAEYSFTNRVFELAALPLLVFAPMLFPAISKSENRQGVRVALQHSPQLMALLRLEMMVAVFVAVMLNTGWVPVIDLLTGNRYGASTVGLIRILSLAIPVVYCNNLLWNMLFARQQLKKILLVFMWGLLVNVTADILLMKFFGAAGAAAGLTLTLYVQALLYTFFLGEGILAAVLQTLLPVAAAGVASILIAGFFSQNLPAQWLIAAASYFAILKLLKIWNGSDWSLAKKVLHPGVADA